MTIPGQIKVVIYPSGGAEETLTVDDAMQQVLDYFALLSKAEVREPGRNEKVVWQLKSASTNSPFTVEASSVSSVPEMSVDRQALQAKQALRDGIGMILRGEAKPQWMDRDAEVVFRRIIERNLNGIGRTEMVVDADAQPITLDHRTARRAQSFLDVKAAEEAALIEDLSRKEYGSVEGRAVGLTAHYTKPALVIRERLSGRDVKCVLVNADAETIGAEHQWNEVWGNRRIIVSGICHYEKSGNLSLVDVEEITQIKVRDVPVSDLRDPTFSDGLSPQEHLDRLWGNGNG